MKMIVCLASTTYFQFYLRQFVHQLDTQLLIHGNCCINSVIPDYNIAYNTLSHVYFLFWEE